MKKSIFKFTVPLLLVLLTVFYSCKKYLTQLPPNSLSNTTLASKAGLDGILIGAYATLIGNASVAFGGSVFAGSPSDWSFAGIASDDAAKGSNPTDQPDAAAITSHTVNSTNGYVENKWQLLYDGIQRANDVIRELPLIKDGSVTAAYAAEVTAEARFLRGVQELEAAKVWHNAPYVDETVTYTAGNYNVPNPGTIWTQIEADFTAAMGVLPATQPQVGRANKYAAEAFLAKTYMFDHKYTQALTALNDLMANGVTSSGAKYALEPYANNFNALDKNGPESVFPVQEAVGSGTQGADGNPGDVLNFPSGGPATCCGFYQPSFDLANAYKTDANGLPLLDGSWKYNGGAIASAANGASINNTTTLKSDQGVLAGDVTYTPDTTTTLDSRLDWTIGRRGIPFLDYGPMPGASWDRDQIDNGPYINVKDVYRQGAAASTSDAYGGWAAGQSTNINFNMIRYSDVLLWAAECETEVGSLANAEKYVNMVRARAADPTGWVYGRFRGYAGGNIATPIVAATVPAANYKVGLYTGQIAGGSQENARQAIQFERRLEFGMEGMRFFDLQRWDGLFGGPEMSGYMASTINSYIQRNTSYPVAYFGNGVLQGAKFTQGTNEIYPIPQQEIDAEAGKLKQNTGY